MMTKRNMPERFIMMTSPSRWRREVRSSGQARKIAPMRKATRAQSQGMRNSGTMNMEKPVAMPAGGMRIFFEGDRGLAFADAPDDDGDGAKDGSDRVGEWGDVHHGAA